MRFSIVEERRVKESNGKIAAVPVFYVESGHRTFIFWRRWDRYYQHFDTVDEAIDLLMAVKEEYHFKSRVITRS